MNYPYFLSWVYSDQPQESPYQFRKQRPSQLNKLKQGLATDEFENLSDKEDKKLELDYFTRLSIGFPTDTHKYLDFHFQKFKEKYLGKEIDFLFFVEETIDHLPKIVVRLKSNPNVKHPIDDFKTFKNTKNIVSSWLEKKHSELTAEKPRAETTKRKPLKINDFNKPELTQVQISLLFKIMKDNRIIANRDLDKKQYAKILDQLTGYSENTIRPNFSEGNPLMISDNPTDYEKIIAKLLIVIEELRKNISDIKKK